MKTWLQMAEHEFDAGKAATHEALAAEAGGTLFPDLLRKPKPRRTETPADPQLPGQGQLV